MVEPNFPNVAMSSVQDGFNMSPEMIEEENCRCIPVNHYAHLFMTLISCGMCLPCWIGACFGSCCKCSYCPYYNET